MANWQSVHHVELLTIEQFLREEEQREAKQTNELVTLIEVAVLSPRQFSC